MSWTIRQPPAKLEGGAERERERNPERGHVVLVPGPLLLSRSAAEVTSHLLSRTVQGGIVLSRRRHYSEALAACSLLLDNPALQPFVASAGDKNGDWIPLRMDNEPVEVDTGAY